MSKITNSYHRIIEEIKQCYVCDGEQLAGESVLAISPINMTIAKKMIEELVVNYRKIFLVVRDDNYNEIANEYGSSVVLILWNNNYSFEMLSCVYGILQENTIESFIFPSEKESCYRDTNIYKIALQLKREKAMKDFYVYRTDGKIYKYVNIERVIDLYDLYNDIDRVIGRYYELIC